jgi:hypothetical protein
MPGKMLPFATAALTAANAGLVSANAGVPALSGYAGVIAPAVAALATVNTQVSLIQVQLPPLALITPPFKLSIGSCIAVLSTSALCTTNIATTTIQSVAAAGLPSPTYAANAAVVVANFTTLIGQIQALLVTPQIA